MFSNEELDDWLRLWLVGSVSVLLLMLFSTDVLFKWLLLSAADVLAFRKDVDEFDALDTVDEDDEEEDDDEEDDDDESDDGEEVEPIDLLASVELTILLGTNHLSITKKKIRFFNDKPVKRNRYKINNSIYLIF